MSSGPATYGAAGDAKRAAMMALERAKSLSDCGVKAARAGGEIGAGRRAAPGVLLYRGDPGETFCLAVGEAQAMGVPAVVQPIAATPERVIDQETGFVARDDNDFATYAVRLLADDELWATQHRVEIPSRSSGAGVGTTRPRPSNG